jgi:hypothetical protein
MADEEHEQPSVAGAALDGSVAAPKAKDGFDTQIESAMQKFTVGWCMVTAAVREFEDAKTTNAALKRTAEEGDLNFLPREKRLYADNSDMRAGNAAVVQSVDSTPWIYDVEIICTQEEKKDYTQSQMPLGTGAAGFATTSALPPRVRKAHNMRRCDGTAYPPMPLDEPTRRSSRLRTAINKPRARETMVPAPRAVPNLDFGHPPKHKSTTILFPAPRAEPDLDLDYGLVGHYTSLPASWTQNCKGHEDYYALVETTREAFAAARHDRCQRNVAWRALASYMQQGHFFFKRTKHGIEKWEQAHDGISLHKFLARLKYKKRSRKHDIAPVVATSPLSEYEVRRARNIERNNTRLLELGLISEQEESRSNQMAWAKNALGTSPLSDYEVRRARNIQRNNSRLRNLGLISEQEESRSNQMAWTKNVPTGQMS